MWRSRKRRRKKKKNAYRLFVGKPEGKGPLGRPKRKWVDNNKMDLDELELGGVGGVLSGLFWLRIGASGGFF
jgi:hypothetical protein